MGSGRWSTNVYDEHARYKAASGKSTFDYSHSLHRRGRSAWHVHKSLDPRNVRSRESRVQNGESLVHPRFEALPENLGIAGAVGVGIAADPVAEFAAQLLVYRHAVGFPSKVP